MAGSQYSFGEPDIQQQIEITQLLGGEIVAPVMSNGHVVGGVADWGYGELEGLDLGSMMMPKTTTQQKQIPLIDTITKTLAAGKPYDPNVQPSEAGLGALLPWILKAIGALGGGSQLLKNIGIIGGGAAAGGLLQSLFGGNGGGTFIPGTTIPIGGPGAPEPPASMIAKEWSTGTARFYMLIDGSIVTRRKSGVWKRWRPAHHIVVPRNPRVGTLVSADKRIDKLMRGVARRAHKSPSYRSVAISKRR